MRVRPAFAGEGRYFVRVPPGTNADNYELMTPQYIDQAALNGAPEDGLDEDERTRMFLQFMAEQHNGFEGTFGGELCAGCVTIACHSFHVIL